MMGTVNALHSESKQVYTFTLASDGTRVRVRPSFDAGEYSPEEDAKMLAWAEKEQEKGHWSAAPMQPRGATA